MSKIKNNTDVLVKYNNDYVLLIALNAVYFVGFLVISAIYFPIFISPPTFHLYLISFGPLVIGVGYLGIKHQIIVGFKSKLTTKASIYGPIAVFSRLERSKNDQRQTASNYKIYLEGKKAKVISIIIFIFGCLTFLYGIINKLQTLTIL